MNEIGKGKRDPPVKDSSKSKVLDVDDWAQYFTTKPTNPFESVSIVKSAMSYLEHNPYSTAEVVSSMLRLGVSKVRRCLNSSHLISWTWTTPRTYYIPCGNVFEDVDNDDLIYLSSPDSPVSGIPYCHTCSCRAPGTELSTSFTNSDDGDHLVRVQWHNCVVYAKSRKYKDAYNMCVTTLCHPQYCGTDSPFVDPSVVAQALRYYRIHDADTLKIKKVRLKILAYVAKIVDPTRAQDHYHSLYDKRFTSRSGMYFYRVRENLYRSFFSSPTAQQELSVILSAPLYRDFNSSWVTSSSGERCQTPSCVMANILAGDVFNVSFVDVSLLLCLVLVFMVRSPHYMRPSVSPRRVLLLSCLRL
jgi:hypothetical protein